MASSRTRAFPIFVNGRKLGEISSATLDLQSGREVIPVFDGTVTTDGRKVVKLDFEQIELTAGASYDLIAQWVAGAEVSIGVPIGTKIVQCTGTINGVSYSSDISRGTSTGRYSFVGGAPDIT